MRQRERLFLAIVTAAFVFASCRPSQTVGRQTDDAAIKAQIKAKLATDVGASTLMAVEVNVTNGVVTLAGPVASEDEKQRIGASAAGVQGVASVSNNLQVSVVEVPPPQPAPTLPPVTTP
ncbi:MAG TPA: BON domain-containing protein [Thermoanaerobaculia bacterium]|nr:BON domain-containing protein [Thermoanaerobaculia bacterium]